VSAIDAAIRTLAEAAGPIERSAPDTWTLMLAGTLARARHEDGWLDLTACADRVPPAINSMSSTSSTGGFGPLERNAALVAGIRLVAADASSGVALRADVPLDPALDVPDRVGAALAALASPAGRPVPTLRGQLPAALLAECHATTWPVEARGDHELTIDLGVSGLVERAVLAARADGTVTVAVPLLERGGPAPASDTIRTAVVHLLMRLAGVVRVVRAAADPGDPSSLRFEVIGVTATTTEIDHACGALAVACRLAAAEVTALHSDEAVARLYLQHHHDAAVPRAA